MLKDLRCAAQIPVADLGRAKRWYAERLDLEPILEGAGEAHYRCGGGTAFTLYESSTAGMSEQTVLAWLTPDIEREVAELRARGVAFESYDFPGLTTDEQGIARIGEDRVAWFKDGEGNVLAVGRSGIGLLEMLSIDGDPDG